MIVKQKRNQRIAIHIKKLVEVLEPIAKKYKQINKAKDAMSAIGWSIFDKGHGDATSCNYRFENNELVQVYQYGKKMSTLSDILVMLKDELPRYESDEEVNIYTLKLCDFVDNAIGEDVECTQDEFKNRKLKTLLALKRAIDWVSKLEDCKNTSSYQFDEKEQE